MSSSRLRAPPPKQTADGWDDEIVSADMTLKLSDLLPPSETSLPWIGDVDLACELLGGDSLTAQGELEGNFFNEPVLSPTKHIREATSSSSKRPSTEMVGERVGSREGKRSRTSTSDHQSTTPADQLPTPSPEPASTHLHPQTTSHRSHRSREPPSSSAALKGAGPSSGRTHNNTTSASSRPTTVTPTEPGLVVVSPVEESSVSTMSVLSWRQQTYEGAYPDESTGAGGGELDLGASSTCERSTSEQPLSASHYRSSTQPQTTHQSRASSHSTVPRTHEPTASSSSRPVPPCQPALHRRPSSVHSTTSVTLGTFKTSSIIQLQSRSTNALNRSTSSSSSVAGPSRSYIADEPAKDDLYERKKRDSYIGQHSVLLPEKEQVSPPSSPRVRRQRVGGAKDNRRVGGTVIGGKRIEKPTHRRHKSPPWASKELPIQALECLIPADTARPAPATAGGVKAMEFFRSFLQTINPKTTPTPAAPVEEPVPAVEQDGPSDAGDIPGSFSVPPTPASEADTNATSPPRPTLRPPTPPRPRPAQPMPKPSAIPPSSRPATTFTVPRSTLTSSTTSSSRRPPLQQTLQRSSNLPPRSLPLGPPLLTKPTRRVVSSSSSSSSQTTSSKPTAPKPFNLLTTSLSHASSSRSQTPSTSHPTSASHRALNPNAGLMPDFSSSHSQLAALERARLARKEALRAKQEEERGKAKEACEAGAVRRREREVYEAQERRRREEGERRRTVEERERSVREREELKKEREKTVIRARPVPEMYKSVSRRA